MAKRRTKSGIISGIRIKKESNGVGEGRKQGAKKLEISPHELVSNA
jgi:hypothetical protein